MQVINLTPHAINVLRDESLEVLEIYPPSGDVARVKVTTREWGYMDGIPTVQNVYGDPEGLPEPQDDTVYLVSLMVLSAVTRPDVFAPDTGAQSVIRDVAGNILGVRRFVAAGE